MKLQNSLGMSLNADTNFELKEYMESNLHNGGVFLSFKWTAMKGKSKFFRMRPVKKKALMLNRQIKLNEVLGLDHGGLDHRTGS